MNDMNDMNTAAQTNDEVWPRRLNKLLMGVGVIAFGAIVVDRLADMHKAEDLPEAVLIQRTGDNWQSETVVVTEQAEAGVVLDIEDVFGGKLVFVSASEPLYVVTENDRRIDVGDTIDEQTTLAGVTGQQVVLEKSGDLFSINLPDISNQ